MYNKSDCSSYRRGKKFQIAAVPNYRLQTAYFLNSRLHITVPNSRLQLQIAADYSSRFQIPDCCRLQFQVPDSRLQTAYYSSRLQVSDYSLQIKIYRPKNFQNFVVHFRPKNKGSKRKIPRYSNADM